MFFYGIRNLTVLQRGSDSRMLAS